jgi:hypothetical protein
MYRDELMDLAAIYKKTMQDLHEDVENCLPSLLHYMEEFVRIHKMNESVREKLDVLAAKIGTASESEESETK